MTTIEALKTHSKGTQPYSLTLKVKAVFIGEVMTYKRNDETRQKLICALAHVTDIVKAICYDARLFPKLALNESL